MNVKIDDLIFDRGNYDADGDVLYLAHGNTSVASEAALTPEGHGVRYDTNGDVIGVTIINARRINRARRTRDDHAPTYSPSRGKRRQHSDRRAGASTDCPSLAGPGAHTMRR